MACKKCCKKTISILVFLSLLIADQISKWFVFEKLLRNDQDTSLSFVTWFTHFQTKADTIASYADFQMIDVTSFFNLVAVWNTGVSFGIFQNSGDMGTYLLSGFAVLCGVVLLIWGLKSSHCIERLACMMIAAGSFGNAWDRIRFKAVADFVDVHVAGYHWPAFNVADSAITLGAGLFIVYIVCIEKSKGQDK